MNRPDQTTAEARVIRKYTKLYAALLDVTESLQKLEPTGTFVDQADFKRVQGKLRVHYKARPVQLVIEEDGKRFTLRVEQLE